MYSLELRDFKFVIAIRRRLGASRATDGRTHGLTPAVLCSSGAEAGAPQPPGEGGRPAAHRGADPAAAKHAVCGAASLRAGCGGEENEHGFTSTYHIKINKSYSN